MPACMQSDVSNLYSWSGVSTDMNGNIPHTLFRHDIWSNLMEYKNKVTIYNIERLPVNTTMPPHENIPL